MDSAPPNSGGALFWLSAAERNRERNGQPIFWGSLSDSAKLEYVKYG